MYALHINIHNIITVHNGSSIAGKQPKMGSQVKPSILILSAWNNQYVLYQSISYISDLSMQSTQRTETLAKKTELFPLRKKDLDV